MSLDLTCLYLLFHVGIGSKTNFHTIIYETKGIVFGPDGFHIPISTYLPIYRGEIRDAVFQKYS